MAHYIELKVLLPFMLPILLKGSLKEAFINNVIPLIYLSTDLQLVVIFTKTLTWQCHQILCSKLMLIDLLDCTYQINK